MLNCPMSSTASSHSSLPFLLRFSSFLHHVVTPTSCLGPLDLSPHSLGFPSSIAWGRCLACALLCATQGRMSACRTRPATNPGGPQGGAQTGRSPGGGWTEAEPPALRNQMLRGFSRYPARTFSALGTDTRRHHRRPEFSKNELQITKCITTAYIITYNNVHI